MQCLVYNFNCPTQQTNSLTLHRAPNAWLDLCPNLMPAQHTSFQVINLDGVRERPTGYVFATVYILIYLLSLKFYLFTYFLPFILKKTKRDR